MTKKTLKPKIHSVWRGRLVPHNDQIRALAVSTVHSIDPAVWSRFCAKIAYWAHNSAENPITVVASDLELFPLHRGCSRLIAGVLYQQAPPMRIWCQGTNPEALIHSVMSKAKMIRTRTLPDSPQAPILGFEPALRQLQHTHIDRDWLIEALVSAERPKKNLTHS